MKFYLALLSVLASVALTVAQNCELQHAPQIAVEARNKLGSEDYAYSGWYNIHAPWFKYKDHWFVSEAIRDAGAEGGWHEVGFLIKHDEPVRPREYMAWWVLAVGTVDGWYWDHVNCEQPCVGDIMAGPVDGGDEDSDITVAVVSDVTRRLVTHVDRESGAVVENQWGFERFGNKTVREHYVCWRYQTFQPWA